MTDENYDDDSCKMILASSIKSKIENTIFSPLELNLLTIERKNVSDFTVAGKGTSD
jgi:hypothetical protein